MLGPLSGRRGFRAGPVLGRRAEVAAQARPDSRAGPARGTDPSVPGRSWDVLFRAVLGPAHRAWPIVPSIGAVVRRVRLHAAIYVHDWPEIQVPGLN
jgi:hypothetical protein